MREAEKPIADSLQSDVTTPTLLVGGLHAGGDGYPNAANTLRHLRETVGIDIVECGSWLPQSLRLWRIPNEGLWSATRQAIRFAVGNLVSLVRVLRDRPNPCTPVYVPYPSVFFLWWSSWIPRRWRPRIIADAYISLWDSHFRDRAARAPGHALGAIVKILEQRALRTAEWIIVDTEANREMYIETFGLARNRVLSAPLAIDERPFLEVPRQSSPSNSTVTVLFIGTMIPLHGVGTIVDAISRLMNLPNVRFRIHGSGQSSGQIASAMSTFHNSRVHWNTGWLSQKQMACEIANADICLGVFGGTGKAARVLPLKLYMYFASGKPVVTQGMYSLPKGAATPPMLAIDPVSGESLAASLREIIENINKRKEYSTFARSYYLKYLGPARIVEIWSRLLLAPTTPER